MRIRTAICAYAAICLFLAALPSRGEKSEAGPAYKNPLDVTVDAKGQIAKVYLSGTRTVAEVDLVSGKIVKETPWPKDKPMPKASDVPSHNPWDIKWFMFYANNGLQLAYYVLPEMSLNSFALAELPKTIPGRPISIHQYAKSHIPTSQISQGWVFTHAISFGLKNLGGYQQYMDKTFGIFDSPQQAYADPSDVVAHSVVNKNAKGGIVSVSHGPHVFVASAGADTVLAMGLTDLPGYVSPPPKAEKLEDLLHIPQYSKQDLTENHRFVKARLRTQSNPRRLSLSGDGKTLVASNYLSDSLTVIDAEKLKVIKHISLNGPPPDAVRRGEILFNSANVTFQGQFSCASCHPNGGSDGLNWDLTRDGVGNFKSTKSLLGIKDTAPYGWLGSSPTLEDRVQGTLRTLHRYEPSAAEVSDLAAYLASLPPPELAVVTPTDQPAVARGKAAFEGKGSCISCHSGKAFDDGQSHNVGTGDSFDDRFNTPSLRGVGRTAPYLHDGRAATLEEIFTKHNGKQRHGGAHDLTKEELADMAAYLRSL